MEVLCYKKPYVTLLWKQLKPASNVLHLPDNMII